MYKIYPTLLDAWVNYKLGRWVSEIGLIRKLSRVKTPETPAMYIGKGLEECINSPEPMYWAYGRYYPKEIVNQLRERLHTLPKQIEIRFQTTFADKLIEFYGYADYTENQKGIDLKYTKQYATGKFNYGTQRHLYLLGANANGIMLNEFEYLVTDLKEIYPEHYTYNKQESEDLLGSVALELIEFAHKHEHKILDRKFFGE